MYNPDLENGRSESATLNMNTPNPLVPQGTFADKGRSHVRLTVFAILAVHLVLLGVLLIAGCNKQGGDQAGTESSTVVPPPPPPVATDWPPLPPPTQNVATVTGMPPSGLVPPPPTTIVEPLPPPPSPPPAAEFREHTIEAGDSFYTLGKKYGVGYKAIGDANPGVDSTRLRIGQRIKIPPPKAAAPVPGASATMDGAPAVSPTGEVTHKVVSGDTLWQLARKYGVKESAIRSANNLRTSRLVVGQKLKIPAKADAPAPVPVTPVEPTGPPPPQ